MNKERLPDGWEWATLGETCNKPEYGYTTSAKPEGDGPKFLRTTDISNGEVDWEAVPYCKEPPQDEDKYLLNDGDVLISRAGSVGESIVIRNPPRAIFASYIIRFRPKIGLNPAYAGYYLKSKFFRAQLTLASSGTTLKGVNASNLSKIKIPLPPLEIQRKIVAILEKAETTQRLRAKADALVQDLVQSVFLDMFGDPEKNPFEWQKVGLSEVLGESLKNGLYKPSTEYGEGTPILRIDSFYEGRIIDIENLKRLRCSPMEIEKYGLDVGDILINRVNSLDYLGKCGLVKYLPEPTVYESNMMRLRLNNAVANPFYVTSMLCTSYVKGQIISRAKKAVNQASINQDDVLSLKILVPPIEIQEKYEDRVRGIEGALRLQKKSQIQQEMLMKSLLSKAFTGELVP